MKILVKGSKVDEQSRCEHYNSPLDIIAIKFKCCNAYYACIHCHNENEKHEVVVWNKDEQNTKAILCGNCNFEMTIGDYVGCNDECPICESLFNPKCSNHHHYYFEV